MAGNVAPVEVLIFPHNFSADDDRVILVYFDFDQLMERGIRMCALSM